VNIDKIVILSLKHFTLSSIIEVAIPVPLHNTFDYLCDQKVSIGARVKVPFGQKKVTAIVLSHKKKSDFDKLRSVEEILDQEALLSKEYLIFYSGQQTITTIHSVKSWLAPCPKILDKVSQRLSKK